MPDSLLEAAVIDGATMGTTFRKIVVPMAKNNYNDSSYIQFCFCME